jgi:hypothetical protein
MKLMTAQSYALLEKYGSYIREVCDACGKGIGPICYARKDNKGVWCSRECRDGVNAHTPGTCKNCKAILPPNKRKGSDYCDDACRQAARRSNPDNRQSLTGELSVTKAPIGVGFCGVPKPSCYDPTRKPETTPERATS